MHIHNLAPDATLVALLEPGTKKKTLLETIRRSFWIMITNYASRIPYEVAVGQRVTGRSRMAIFFPQPRRPA
jgi:hypothetical protein